jgi:hypothetical protein
MPWCTPLVLLQGEWPLTEKRLLDRAHLRWLTRAGLELQQIQPRIFQLVQAQALVTQFTPVLPGRGIKQERLLRGVAPLQCVVAARKP